MAPREITDSNRHYGTAVNHEITLQQQEQPKKLECDYLVIGAGTSGMSFVDTIITKDPKARLIVVDRNDKPGGHWVHAYPFCKLHQSSCNYGVNSTTLGRNLNKRGHERYDIHDRSTGQDVVDYYQRVRERCEATGRVRFFFGANYERVDEQTGVHVITTSASNGGDENHHDDTVILNVKCLRKLVTIESNVTVPAMRGPTIPVHEDASFVPVNALQESIDSNGFRSYIVFGCGKTGADAIVHLLRQGIDPSNIRWIVPRDYWYFVRDEMEDFYQASFTTFMEPFLSCASVKDVYLDWEARGLLDRLDHPTGEFPKVMKGPIMDAAEIDLMRSIENVVRMGRALSVEEDTVLLEEGSIRYDPHTTLLVDCMVGNHHGYDFADDFRIFEEGRIRMGPQTLFWNVSCSAAHIAFLECALGPNNDVAKNDCCYFTKGITPGRLEAVIGGFYLQNKTIESLMKIKGGPKFFMQSRTSMAAPIHHKGGMLGFLWNSFGPRKGAKKGKKFERKVEAGGFADLDHCFGFKPASAMKKAF